MLQMDYFTSERITDLMLQSNNPNFDLLVFNQSEMLEILQDQNNSSLQRLIQSINKYHEYYVNPHNLYTYGTNDDGDLYLLEESYEWLKGIEDCKEFLHYLGSVFEITQIMDILASRLLITGPQLKAIVMKHIGLSLSSTDRNNLHNLKRKLEKAKELVTDCKPFENFIL